MSKSWLIFTALTTAVALAGAPRADAAACAAHPESWWATFAGQSGYLTLESGQIATSWFEACNGGSAIWNRDSVRLGTSYPYNRSSQFYVAGEWLDLPGSPASRPAALDQPSVAPGAIGRFTFKVKAPSVASAQSFDEHFTPVVEGVTWMNWGNVFINYTVKPATPPSVRILSTGSDGTPGAPVTVTASADDNVGVARVEFTLDSTRVTDSTRDADGLYRATLPTAGLAPGNHALAVRAFDVVEQTTADAGTVHVAPPAAAEPTQTASSEAEANAEANNDLDIDINIDNSNKTTIVSGRRGTDAGTAPDVRGAVRQFKVTVQMWLLKRHGRLIPGVRQLRFRGLQNGSAVTVSCVQACGFQALRRRGASPTFRGSGRHGLLFRVSDDTIVRVVARRGKLTPRVRHYGFRLSPTGEAPKFFLISDGLLAR